MLRSISAGSNSAQATRIESFAALALGRATSSSSTSLRRIAAVMLVLVGFLACAQAQAFDPEWAWRVSGSGQPVFPTKAQAVAQMHSLTTDPRYPLLTIERRVSQVSENSEFYTYEAPKQAAIGAAWCYLDSSWGSSGGCRASESEWVTDREARLSLESQCPSGTLTPAGNWYIIAQGGYGGLTTREGRAYQGKWYSRSTGQCVERTINLTAFRDRGVSCPSGYLGEGAAPGCYLPFSAEIIGTRTSCEGSVDNGTRGNPCNAVTGDKFETERDYSGPFDLGFERYYHSRSLDATNGLGVGWSHNYQPKLIISNGGTLIGMIRTNGYRESLTGTNAAGYVSVNGVVVRASPWRVFLQDGTIETYNNSGQLTSIARPQGGTTTLTYSGGLLSTVSGPFGHQLQLQYDSSGRLAHVVTPASQSIDFTYVDDNLTAVSYPDGTSRTYHYEEAGFPNHLTGITDESSNRFSTFDYDSMGRVTESKHAGNVERYAITYNPTNSIVTDPLGTVETINFTTTAAWARRITQTSKAGQTWAYTVPSNSADAQRRVTQKTDPRGQITKLAYNTYHLTTLTEAFGTPAARITSYAYLDNNSDLPTLVTEPNRTAAYTYDSRGNVLSKTLTDTSVVPNVSRSWTYTYDSYGRTLSEDGPRTDVSDLTTYTYYTCSTGIQCGRVQTVTDALGHTTTFLTYNAEGQPLTFTDANGTLTTLTYDSRQRLTSRTVAGDVTLFEHWPTGRLKKVTQPDGSYLQYTYDAAHRLTGIADGEGNHVDYVLDAMGNRTSENAYDPSNALSRSRTQVFDALNRLWKQIGSAGTPAVTTVFGYDNNGNETSVHAPLARNTASEYDELNRLKQITDAASGVTLLTYDSHDNVTAVTDPRGKVTSYSYNGLDELTQLVSPDTGTTANTYDSGGNLATATDARGSTGTYSYDALNRPTQLAYVDRTLSFTYDAGPNGVGRLTGASDTNHSMSWVYDPLGRVTSKSQTVGALTRAVSYGYTNGNLTSITTPSGQVIGYSYAQGRVTTVTLNGSTTLLQQALYEPFGPIRQWTWGNGTLADRAYDLDGNPSVFESAGAASYSVDDAFRITGVVDLGDTNLSWVYGYDLLDRLSSAATNAQTIGLSYDANGNRVAQTGSNPATYTVSGTSNRIDAVSGTPARVYAYDAAGNVTGDGSSTFAYADSGRMRSHTVSGVATTYTLNALGQRVRKSGSSGTTVFVYDEAGHLLGEYDAAGALIQETVWLGDVPIATLRPDSGGVRVYYVHSDHLNTPRRLSRPSDNAIVWRWDSDPFGTLAPNEDPDGDGTLVIYNPRFPGQYFDVESGLSYNYFRDYDSATGRYVESDLIGLQGGINTYAYGDGNPISMVDLLGLLCRKGERVLRDDVTKKIYSRKMVGELTVPFIGDVHAELGLSPEPSPRIPGWRPGIGANLSWDIIYFVWDRYEIRDGYVQTKFFNRKYYCKADDLCQQPQEWVELRPDRAEQEAVIDVRREWEYKGTRPYGYTTATP